MEWNAAERKGYQNIVWVGAFRTMTIHRQEVALPEWRAVSTKK